MIVVELAWLGECKMSTRDFLVIKFIKGVLWILWLSSAATASQADSLVFGAGCNYRNSEPFSQSHTAQAHCNLRAIQIGM